MAVTLNGATHYTYYLIYKGESVFVCVCVCVSGIEIHTIGPILTKFGMGA